MIVLTKVEVKRVFGIVGRNINILRRNSENLSHFIAKNFTGKNAAVVLGLPSIQDDLDRLSEKMDDSVQNFELYQELKGKFTALYSSFLGLISCTKLKVFKDEYFEECEDFEEFEEPN